MQNDLISRSALKRDLLDRSFFPTIVKAALENAPAVDAVPVEVLGKWGKLLLPYKGDPRGPVGRMCDGHLEEEALCWGVVTDADGGRWVPVYEAVLLELIEKAKANDPESLRLKGLWVGEGDGYADDELVYDVWYCSECNYCIDDGTDDPKMLPNYCPNCGAKMMDG